MVKGRGCGGAACIQGKPRISAPPTSRWEGLTRRDLSPTTKANVRGLSSLIPNLCKAGDLVCLCVGGSEGGGWAQPNESQALELESLPTSGFY